MIKTKIQFLLISSLLVLLGAACSGKAAQTSGSQDPGAAPSSASAGSEGQWSALLDLPADPLDLEVSLQEGAGVSAVFSYEGGTLTASGADGTLYTLEIPEGALEVPTQIRMTPLADLGGLPIGEGAPYGVQLEPDGLRLYDVAILTITPPAEIPLEQQVFISYQGQEHEFSFAAPLPDSPELKIMVTHFSGYGVQKGLLADYEALRERLGGDVERRIQEIVAREIGVMRQKALLGIVTEADRQAMQDLFAWVDKVFYEEVLKPRLDAAEESCAAGRLALVTLLGYERQLQLLGFGTSHLAEMNALTLNVSDKCMQEEYELCRDDHIIHRIIPVVLSVMRQSQLLGIEDQSAAGLEAKGNDLVRKCLSFELELESEIITNPPNSWRTESKMTSKVKLQIESLNDLLASALNQGGEGIHGEAPLVNESYSVSSNAPGCQVTNSSRGGSTLHISQLSWELDFRGEDDELGYIKDLSMVISPDPTTESFTGRCGPSVFNADNSNAWSSAWGAIHQQGCMAAQAEGSSGGDVKAQVLTAAASEGSLDPVIGRDDEIRRVIQVLSRRTKNNPVLIGEPGVG
ncbi:MAG: hypothetical protein AB8I40_05105, partial [Anaerolineales bacterium]